MALDENSTLSNFKVETKLLELSDTDNHNMPTPVFKPTSAYACVHTHFEIILYWEKLIQQFLPSLL